MQRILNIKTNSKSLRPQNSKSAPAGEFELVESLDRDEEMCCWMMFGPHEKMIRGLVSVVDFRIGPMLELGFVGPVENCW